jgi:hypothetical protein
MVVVARGDIARAWWRAIHTTPHLVMPVPTVGCCGGAGPVVTVTVVTVTVVDLVRFYTLRIGGRRRRLTLWLVATRAPWCHCVPTADL